MAFVKTSLLVLLVGASISGCDKSSAGSASKHFTDPKVAALAEALQSSDFAKAEQAIRDGADMNTISKDGMSVLVWTMYLKNKPSFKWLLDHGANPNLIPSNDRGVLLWAAAADDPDWLDMLFQHKADPNLQRPMPIRIETPLSEAIHGGHRRNLELVIQAGGNVNFKAPEELGGETPVLRAASIGWFEGVYVLLKADADIQQNTTGGDNVTYFVVSRYATPGSEYAQWKEKVLQRLKDRGADIEAAEKKVLEKEARDKQERPWDFQNKNN